MTDPISDMLTRIRNASVVKKQEVVMPLSKLKVEVAKILKREGWVHDYEVLSSPSGGFDNLKISLKYKKSGRPVITKITRISRPGRRIYTKKENLPKVLNNLGMAIISTPKGLMTNKEARKTGLGGEIICEVY